MVKPAIALSFLLPLTACGDGIRGEKFGGENCPYKEINFTSKNQAKITIAALGLESEIETDYSRDGKQVKIGSVGGLGLYTMVLDDKGDLVVSETLGLLCERL